MFLFRAVVTDLFFFTKSMFAFQVEKPGGPFGPANLFSEPHELRFRSWVLHHRVWSHA